MKFKKKQIKNTITLTKDKRFYSINALEFQWPI